MCGAPSLGSRLARSISCQSRRMHAAAQRFVVAPDGSSLQPLISLLPCCGQKRSHDLAAPIDRSSLTVVPSPSSGGRSRRFDDGENREQVRLLASLAHGRSLRVLRGPSWGTAVERRVEHRSPRRDGNAVCGAARVLSCCLLSSRCLLRRPANASLTVLRTAEHSGIFSTRHRRSSNGSGTRLSVPAASAARCETPIYSNAYDLEVSGFTSCFSSPACHLRWSAPSFARAGVDRCR
jgi:hypothetical protein